MRKPTCLLIALALVAVPGVVRADDPPATENPAAKAPEAPSAAWSRLNAETSRLPYAQRREALKDGAATWLDAFADRGGVALGREAVSLGHLQRTAGRPAAAAATFRLVWTAEDQETPVRDQAAVAEAQLLSLSELRDAMGEAAVAKTVGMLREYAAGMAGDEQVGMRSGVEIAVAGALDTLHRDQEAYDLRIAVVKRDPEQAARVFRALGHHLLGRTHAMDGYDALCKEAGEVEALLVTQHGKVVEAAQARLDVAIKALKEASPASVTEDGKVVSKPAREMSQLERVAANAERGLGSAKAYLDRLQDFGRPFRMLGKPAPAWTLEHAFGETTSIADLKGKVVVLDFWATWCPWCIRSFPAIRDLLRDYADRGLVVVGVTASASSVYAQRYDLDDDLKEKAEPGQPVQPAARMPRGVEQPDGETIFAPEAYPAKEKEVITTFIANHQMTWPVVMIDKAEPGPKYALTGWPHAVVIDREGRVRYFKSGALLRDRPDDVQKFRKLLEDLMAEGGKGAGPGGQ